MSNQNEQYSPGYRPKLINDYKQRHIRSSAPEPALWRKLISY